MITAGQVFAVLGILCAPMISIATIVLILAALNLSLGLRRLYVRILAFIFDYATKIKQDKEVPITPHGSTDEPSTPGSPVVERSPDDPIKIDPKTPLVSESKSQENTDDVTTTTDQEQRGSGNSTEFQFRLGEIFFILITS